jgi:hypothetical protein
MSKRLINTANEQKIGVLNKILEFIFIYIQIKTEKLTGWNKVLLVLDQRTDAQRED